MERAREGLDHRQEPTPAVGAGTDGVVDKGPTISSSYTNEGEAPHQREMEPGVYSDSRWEVEKLPLHA